ncbi:MAG: hypothetical protein KIT56_01300 [Gammaproteobacteria bacterium]|nr:hypothetical protein [Gammaproteobacteria bacterium]MCW5582521.1 hypothetical protein [Gammaproteobacteria bacterium]
MSLPRIIPWSSDVIRERFQAMVNSMVDFHDSFGKPKNQEEFGKIKEVCEIGLNFLFHKDMPTGADQVVASLSTGIFQTVLMIAGKKSGGEENAQFMQKMLAISKELNSFRNACEREIAQKEREEAKPKAIIGKKSADEDNAQFKQKMLAISKELNSLHNAWDREIEQKEREETKPKAIGEDSVVPLRRALTHLDTREELEGKINSLGIVPVQPVSCISFFKRVISHHPKTMVVSGLSGIMAMSHIGFSVLGHYLGNTLDTLLHADETGIDHQTALSLVFVLVSGVLAATAVSRTCVKTCASRDSQSEASEYTRLVATV